MFDFTVAGHVVPVFLLVLTGFTVGVVGGFMVFRHRPGGLAAVVGSSRVIRATCANGVKAPGRMRLDPMRMDEWSTARGRGGARR